MDSEVTVSLVALLVALLALIIASGQLIQAVFGTAEGYRNCQRTVIGPWASLTKRVWLWSEFRFQTRFTTPYIQIQTMLQDPEDGIVTKDSKGVGKSFVLQCEAPNAIPSVKALDSDPKPPSKSGYSVALFQTLALDKRSYFAGGGKASWLLLLKVAFDFEQGAIAEIGRSAYPGVSFSSKLFSFPSRILVSQKKSSWDLVPADVTKPYAQSTMGSIIILAHRLGMRWKEISLAHGFLVAEGDGCSLASLSIIRGLGILFEFRTDLKYPENRLPPLIPCVAADMLSCGLLPVRGFIKSNAYSISTHIRALLGECGFHDKIIETKILTNELSKEESLLNLILSTIIPLTTPFLPLINSIANRVIWPYSTSGIPSPLYRWEGLSILRDGVEAEMVKFHSPFLSFVRDGLVNFERTFKDDYYHGNYRSGAFRPSIFQNESKIKFIEHFRSEMMGTMQRLTQIFSDSAQSKMAYSILLRDLITSLPQAFEDTREFVYGNKKPQAEAKAESDQWLTPDAKRPISSFVLAMSNKLVDNLHSKTIPSVRGNFPNTFDSDQTVVEAWYGMMYRGVCWYAPLYVDLESDPATPDLAQYYDSNLPVYIA